MKHDWEAFGNQVATLIKTRGNRGCRGCSPYNSLAENNIVVTPHEAQRLPHKFEGLLGVGARGNQKTAPLQHVGSVATPVTPGTPCFQLGPAQPQTGGAPPKWHAVLAELEQQNCPDWLAPDRWAVMLSDAESFLGRWGDTAHQLGWTALDLFGIHPVAPAARFDVMGLLPLLHEGAVIALTEDAATIRRSSNALLTYRRGDQAGAVCITEVKP